MRFAASDEAIARRASSDDRARLDIPVAMTDAFEFPDFFEYPPYFTCVPVPSRPRLGSRAQHGTGRSRLPATSPTVPARPRPSPSSPRALKPPSRPSPSPRPPRSLQPNPDTQRKQVELWKSLILRRVGTADAAPSTDRTPSGYHLHPGTIDPRGHLTLPIPHRHFPISRLDRYCRHHRAFTLHLEDDAHPLFANPRCRRRLPLDARRAMVDALVADGAAEWLDHPTRTRCLVLWRSIGAWADILWEWAAAYGLQGQVASEEDVVGPGGPERFRGAGSELVERAARALEEAGKAAYIPGEGGDDAGIKFF